MIQVKTEMPGQIVLSSVQELFRDRTHIPGLVLCLLGTEPQPETVSVCGDVDRCQSHSMSWNIKNQGLGYIT